MPVRSTTGDRFRRVRKKRKRVYFAGGVLLLVVLIAGAAFSYQALQARSALTRAEVQAQQLRAELIDGDQAGAKATLKDLKTSTARASAITSGPLWSLGSKVPVLGDDLDAIRIISRALDRVARAGLQPLVNVAGEINANTFSPRDGRIDVKGIKAVAPALADAHQVLAESQLELRSIDPDKLLAPLRGPVVKLREKIDDAESTADSGAKAAQLLPTMLGASGNRSYVLAFQNNAEVRSSGGLAGAYAILRAEDGKLRITDQGTASAIGYFDPPVIKLAKDERNLYSNLMASLWGDSNFTPDFPRTAEIMRAMLKERFDLDVDGVISVDPIALSYILEGTGAVTLEDGTELNSGNAVSVLLNEVYLKFADSGELQDAYFADAARRVFEAVASGKGDAGAVLRALSKAAGENRILVESAESSEQDILASTRIAGVLPRTPGKSPHIGLYLNDSTETKLQYYLRRRTEVESIGCSKKGAQKFRLTTRMTSTVPKDAADAFPPSILGPGTGERPGSMRMNLRYYAPSGGVVTDMAINGVPVTVNLGKHYGREVAILPVLLAPGERVSVVASITSGEGQVRNGVFATTPGIEATPNNVPVTSSCTG